MQIQVDIGFEQLVQIARRLPASQWKQLKGEVEKQNVEQKALTELESFLLTAPTFTKEQLNEIAETRKSINQWRTK